MTFRLISMTLSNPLHVLFCTTILFYCCCRCCINIRFFCLSFFSFFFACSVVSTSATLFLCCVSQPIDTGLLSAYIETVLSLAFPKLLCLFSQNHTTLFLLTKRFFSFLTHIEKTIFIIQKGQIIKETKVRNKQQLVTL